MTTTWNNARASAAPAKSRSTTGYARWFVGPSVMLATLAATMFFLFFIASIGLLESALIWAGIAVAVGLVTRIMRLP